MRASLDTNVIIHLYTAGLQRFYVGASRARLRLDIVTIMTDDPDDYDTPDDYADDTWGDDFGDWDDAYEYWEDNYWIKDLLRTR